MSTSFGNTFKLSVYSPERKLVESEEVSSLLITTVEGETEVLPGHVDMISQLETGRFEYRPLQGKPVTGVISSGFLNVQGGSVKIVAETLELPHEIDVNRARAAQQKAEQMLTDASLAESDFRKYQLKLQRAIIRQGVSGIH